MRLPFLASLALFGLTACTSGRDGYVTFYDDGVATAVSTEDIDLDAGLETDPGLGVGLTVEAETGGSWRITTTCDTPSSGYLCEWDLVLSVPEGAGPLDVTDDSTLEEGDDTIRVDEGALRVILENGSDQDYVILSGPDGADLTLDLILDGLHDAAEAPPQSRVSWVSAGTIHTGAPSNPVRFHPVTP